MLDQNLAWSIRKEPPQQEQTILPDHGRAQQDHITQIIKRKTHWKKKGALEYNNLNFRGGRTQ